MPTASGRMPQLKRIGIWALVVAAIAVPLALSAASPLLQWRSPVYIAAGFAGVLSLTFLLLQPLLAGGLLPGLSRKRSRQLHKMLGGALVLGVAVHVGGLWVTSPPDVIDALLFRSPTPFSLWGVLAMWALFLTALIAAVRTRLRLSLRGWQQLHLGLAAGVVAGTIAHALLIEGTMEPISKAALCLLVLAAFGRAFLKLKRRRMKTVPAAAPSTEEG